MGSNTCRRIKKQSLLSPLSRRDHQQGIHESQRIQTTGKAESCKGSGNTPTEDFPFNRQPKLKKKMVMEVYDSLNYIQQAQVLCFIGPTGCGKSGLATAYLINALNKGHQGRFIDFRDLMDILHRSQADYSQKKILRQLADYDCLLIDELGYCSFDKEDAGLFFDLMKQRHKKKCTIITTQLGFDEWNSFLNNKHIVMALIDRITENCIVFDMQKCISIRKKNIKLAAEE